MGRGQAIGALHGSRIGINAHLLAHDQGYRQAGVSRYICNLLLHLVREDPDGDYTIFVNSRFALSLPYRQKRSRLPTHSPWIRILWEQCMEPWELLAERIALLHSPVNVQPLAAPCKSVVTVLDLSFILLPQAFRALQRLYHKVFTRLSVRRASHVIAISAHTAQDLVRLFAAPAAKLSVTYPGVDAEYQPIPEGPILESFRRRRNLPDRFILFVGTLEPRKNLITLVRAYERFRRQSATDCKLVIGGGKGWAYQPLFALVEELGLQQEVLFPGFVPQDDLALWYNAADVFAYPSLYEGFGLPPLEAMACGTPVIVSDASSLPEVVGGAGLKVSPHDIDEWAAALSALCSNDALRAELAERGLEQARQFSWTRMARETIRVYQGVLAGGA